MSRDRWHRLGLRRAHRLRFAADGRRTRCVCPARIRAAAPSFSATRCSSTPYNGNEWTPLQNLTEEQARFWIYDSLLSEYAALGFEYGYSVQRRGRPRGCGRLSSVTSHRVHSRSSMSSSPPPSRSGSRTSVSSCCCRTATRDRDPDHSSGTHRAVPAAVRRVQHDRSRYPSSGASYFHLLRRHAVTTN